MTEFDRVKRDGSVVDRLDRVDRDGRVDRGRV